MRAAFSALALVTTIASAPAFAATIVPATPGLTTIGTFGPGTYTVSTTGTVDLAGGGSFVVDANGKPVTSITSSGYGYCNPNGCDFDVFSAAYGVAGAGINLGALAGTINGGTSYFLLGVGSTFTLGSTATLSALVNDTYYPNDSGEFSVSIGAVPEPVTWAMMIAGFGVAGAALRRRGRGVAAVA